MLPKCFKLHGLLLILCFVAVILPTRDRKCMSPNQLQDGSTAVMYACQLNHLSIADKLIEAGADLELPIHVSYANEHEYVLSP